jgi:hypothetical protein
MKVAIFRELYPPESGHLQGAVPLEGGHLQGAVPPEGGHLSGRNM